MEKAEKINIRDLSIGDWVCAEQLCGVHSEPRLAPPMKVVGLGESWVNLEIDPEQGDPFEFEPSEIRGVPITTEVLEKNGFVDNGVGQHYLKCGNGVTVRVGRSPLFHDGCWLVATDKQVDETITTTCVLFNAKQLHELQRAMRLAKAGKEIVL